MRRFLICLLLLLCSAMLFAQQPYVARFDAFTGYSYLTTPSLGLNQQGFNGQFALNYRRWVALGVDYSIFFGNANLSPWSVDVSPYSSLTHTNLGNLVPTIEGLRTLPGFTVPYSATTWSLAVGPAFNWRPDKEITVFVHPDLGVMHESVTAKPNPNYLINSVPLEVLVTDELIEAGVFDSSGGKTDTTVFYGGAAGFDLNFSKHVHWRTSVNVVHLFLFKHLLANSQTAVRFSTGPTFDWGRNVK